MAGISPGRVRVFLLAGPATNLVSVGLPRRELRSKATAAYLVGIGGLLKQYDVNEYAASVKVFAVKP